MRTIKIRSNCWSNQHRYMLYACARRVQRIFAETQLDLDELVDVGWLDCARRTMDLKGTMTNTIRRMIFFVKDFYLKKQLLPLDGPELSVEYEPMDVFDDLLQAASVQISESGTRTMFVMHFAQGMSAKTIGKAMGLSGETVRMRLKAACDSIILGDDNILVQK